MMVYQYYQAMCGLDAFVFAAVFIVSFVAIVYIHTIINVIVDWLRGR
jgi:formate/nitrite transporter FocA (FNT family)